MTWLPAVVATNMETMRREEAARRQKQQQDNCPHTKTHIESVYGFPAVRVCDACRKELKF